MEIILNHFYKSNSNINRYTLFISILLYILVSGCTTVEAVLNETEYQLSYNLRSLFHLESIYPENLSSVPPIDFCSSPSIFSCDPTNTTIQSLVLYGSGTEQLNGEMVNFTNINSMEFYNIDTSADINFVFKMPHPLSRLICFRCNIQKLENPTMKTWAIRYLYLNDNPISGIIYSSSLSSLSEFDYRAFDLSYIRELHWVLDSEHTNYVPAKFKGFISSIFNATTLRSASFEFNFQTGLNFNTSTLNLLGTFPILSGLIINDTKVSTYPSIDFPWDIIPTSIGLLELYQLNLNAPSVYYNLSTYPKLYQLVIQSSPNYNINGEAPFSDLGNLQYIYLNKIGLTKPFDQNIRMDSLVLLSLANNSITGTLPLYPSIKFLTFSNNKFSGVLPKEYCTVDFIAANNLLDGVLPSCVTCHLYSANVRQRIFGNQFSNYRDTWTSSQYPPCTTLKLETALLYDQSSLVAQGTDLGWDGPFATLFPQILGSLELEEEFVTFPYISTSKPFFQQIIRDGYVNITFPSANNLSVSAPVVVQGANISSIDARTHGNDGILFFLTGKGFGSNLTRIAMALGSYECVVNLAIQAAATCVVYDLNIPDDTYIFKVTVLTPSNSVVTTNYTYTYRRNYTYPFVSAATSCPVAGGTITIYGIYGYDYANSSTKIGDLDCSMKSINFSTIVCILTQRGTFGPKDVVVTVNSVVFNASTGFLYEDDPEKLNCVVPDCNGHGLCSYGQCMCDRGWVGYSCDQMYAGPVVVVPGLNSTTIIKDNARFDFQLYSIVERDGSLAKVREVPLTDFVASSSNNSMWTYTTRFETAVISYSIQYFNQVTNITFAGLNLTMDSDSIKLTASISYWRFLGRLNTLQLVLKTSVKFDSQCAKTNINSIAGNTLNYLSIEKDGKTLQGRFIDRVLSDGRPTFSTTEIIKQTEEEVYIGLNLPFCSVCVMDPDFSVLVNPNPPDQCTEGKRLWVLPVAIVVPVVAATLIIILALFIRTKFYIKLTRGGILIVKKASQEDKDLKSHKMDNL